MLSRVLVPALIIAMSASATSAAPVLDAGDAVEARMAKLEAKINKLEFADKVEKLAEEHGVKKQFVKEQRRGGGLRRGGLNAYNPYRSRSSNLTGDGV